MHHRIGFDRDVKLFNSAEAALSFLCESEEPPFMIMSDINMPKMDGIDFKKQIEECHILKPKCIPFIFLSTSTKFVNDTCDLNIQGYFEKGNSWEEAGYDATHPWVLEAHKARGVELITM